MGDDHRLSHLENLRDDVRDEVKKRIQQRDQYSMQQTVALGAIALGAFSAKGTPKLFVLAPLVCFYFTALILYSYRIHDMLVEYLRTQLEPEFEAVSGVPRTKEWETWYQAAGRKPGVRRWFFVVQMWVVTLLALLFLWHKDKEIPPDWFHTVLLVATVAYLALIALLPLLLRKEKRKHVEDASAGVATSTEKTGTASRISG